MCEGFFTFRLNLPVVSKRCYMNFVGFLIHAFWRWVRTIFISPHVGHCCFFDLVEHLFRWYASLQFANSGACFLKFQAFSRRRKAFLSPQNAPFVLLPASRD